MVACAPWGAAGELAASHHGALTRTQAAATGVSKRVLDRLFRDEAIDEPAPGVLVVRGAPPTWRQQLYVATQACNGAGVAGFRAAAVLHEFDGYESGPVELLLPSARRSHINGVIHHRGPMGSEHTNDFTVVDGIRCTGVARTLCDIGSVDSNERVRIAFESAWRRGYSLAWMRQTADRLHRPANAAQACCAGSLIPPRRTRGQPNRPSRFWSSELWKAFRAWSVSSASSMRAVDSSLVPTSQSPSCKIAIEAHSRRFHFGPAHENCDAERESKMQAEGWIVRYVTSAQARHAGTLRSSIEVLIAARRS